MGQTSRGEARSALRRDRAAALLRKARIDPRRRELSLHAADGAFAFFLSLGPLTALVLALLPCTPLTENELLTELLVRTPAAFRRVVQGVVTDIYARGGAALGASLALELWSGARFFSAVRRGIEALRGTAGPGGLRRRLLAAAGTAAALLLLGADLLLLRFGAGLLYAARLAVPALDELWSALLRLRPVLLWAGLTAGNALLYRSLRRPWLLAAGLAAGAGLVFSRLYSGAMERLGLFGGVYGSIAAAAATLYWMYGALYILLLGAWLGALLEENLPKEY